MSYHDFGRSLVEFSGKGEKRLFLVVVLDIVDIDSDFLRGALESRAHFFEVVDVVHLQAIHGTHSRLKLELTPPGAN
jgi:hypothetical protein